MHRLQELVRLHRMGTRVREVARLLRMGPSTERDYRLMVEDAGLLEGCPRSLPTLAELKAAVELGRTPAPTPKHECSSIVQWEQQVAALMKLGLTPQPIYDRLRLEEAAFGGSYWSIRRMYRRLKRADGVRAEDVAICVQTSPGEIAQVDFGYVGKMFCPNKRSLRRAWVFVMTLGHSRHMYAEVVFDQRSDTWITLHERAFAFFGGVPKTVVPDNLKAAVIRAAFGADGQVSLNRSYRELAQHYAFKIDPAPPYSPEKKGKVEASVKYVKRNGLAGRQGESIVNANASLLRWINEIAGQRMHGTTRQKPLVVFADVEKSHLTPPPSHRYEAVVWHKAKVHQNSHVTFDRRSYSVPWRWIGSEVWVRASSHTVAVLGDDVRIATHDRNGPGHRSTNEAHLPEHRRALRHRNAEYWQERAERVGSETGSLIREIFESDPVLSPLRKVQAIVLHLEKHSADRAEAASRRARFFGTYSYRGVKQILLKKLDSRPLPSLLPIRMPGKVPQYARSVPEMVAFKLQQVSDESD